MAVKNILAQRLLTGAFGRTLGSALAADRGSRLRTFAHMSIDNMTSNLLTSATMHTPAMSAAGIPFFGKQKNSDKHVKESLKKIEPDTFPLTNPTRLLPFPEKVDSNDRGTAPVRLRPKTAEERDMDIDATLDSHRKLFKNVSLNLHTVHKNLKLIDARIGRVDKRIDSVVSEINMRFKHASEARSIAEKNRLLEENRMREAEKRERARREHEQSNVAAQTQALADLQRRLSAMEKERKGGWLDSITNMLGGLGLTGKDAAVLGGAGAAGLAARQALKRAAAKKAAEAAAKKAATSLASRAGSALKFGSKALRLAPGIGNAIMFGTGAINLTGKILNELQHGEENAERRYDEELDAFGPMDNRAKINQKNKIKNPLQRNTATVRKSKETSRERILRLRREADTKREKEKRDTWKKYRMNLGMRPAPHQDMWSQFAGTSGISNDEAIMNKIARQRVEEQTMDFLKYGKMVTGFQTVPGNMGRLGNPAFVVARGAQPFGGMGGGRSMGSTGPRYNLPGTIGSTTASGTSTPFQSITQSATRKQQIDPNAYKNFGSGNIPIDRKGNVDKQAYYNAAVKKFASSPLNGFVPADGEKYGIDGTPESWAKFAMRVTKVESGFNVNTTNMNDPGGSFGLMQWGMHYGINKKNWQDPNAQLDAFVTYSKKWVVDGGGYIKPPEGVQAKRYKGHGGFSAAFSTIRNDKVQSKSAQSIANQLAENAPKNTETQEQKTQRQQIDKKNQVDFKPVTSIVNPSIAGISFDQAIRQGNKTMVDLKNSALGTSIPLPKGGLSKQATTQNMRKGRWNRKGGNPYAQKGDMISFRTAYGHRITVNKDAARAYEGMFKDLKAAGYPVKRVGSLNIRAKRGRGSWSQHSYGNAVDIDDTIKFSREQKEWMRKNPGLYDQILGQWGMVSRGGSMNWDEQHIEFGGSIPNATLKRLTKEKSDPKHVETGELTTTIPSEISKVQPVVERTKTELAQDKRLNFQTGEHINQGFTAAYQRPKGPPVRHRNAIHPTTVAPISKVQPITPIAGTTTAAPSEVKAPTVSKQPALVTEPATGQTNQKQGLSFSAAEMQSVRQSAATQTVAAAEAKKSQEEKDVETMRAMESTKEREKSPATQEAEKMTAAAAETVRQEQTGSGTGFSGATPSLTNHPESQGESEGAGGYGSFGRCFV